MSADNDLDYEDYIERWDSRASMWYSPIDWLNFKEQRMFDTSCTHNCRYLKLLYYSSINLGTGEIAPMNEVEFVWFICTLLFSSLLFSIFFSNITSQLLELTFDDMEKQK